MFKALFIDLDGVIIKARHKYFSDRLSEEHNIPIEEILKFFKNEYGLAARGEADIRDVLPDYLTKWGWKGDVDSFLEYWFEGEIDTDENVINAIKVTRENGIKVYIVSDNEKMRAEFVNERLQLPALVDGSFYSYALGVKKSKPAFFTKVLEELGLQANEVMYIDDDPKNIEVGIEVGLNAQLYEQDTKITELIENH